MADLLRAVARAYYERASKEERDEAKGFFTKLDLNGDGKITPEEFKTGFDSRPSAEEFFQKLDSDSDGALDFSEVLVLFYHRKNAISISRCDGCNQRLFEPYFSCLLCLDNYPHTYDLCCDCHRGAKFKHHHSSNFMLHDEAALVKFLQTKAQPAKPRVEASTSTAITVTAASGQSEMGELREIAKAHFEASSPKSQGKAREFFNSMDSDGDGKVELSEFSSFMSGKGYKLMSSPEFFKKLDGDGDGCLDFWEVTTLHYIIKSGRPFCDGDGCGEFIPATFFTCVHCFKAGSSFDLCLRCYKSDFKHAHKGRRAQFLDNYALLQTKHASSTDDDMDRVDAAFNTLGSVLDLANMFSN